MHCFFPWNLLIAHQPSQISLQFSILLNSIFSGHNLKIQSREYLLTTPKYYIKIWSALFFYFIICFWEREREREREGMNGGGAGREGDTESEAASRLWAVSTESDVGLELTDREIMTWAEVGRLTDWATQAPQQETFLTNLSQCIPILSDM